MNRFRKSAKTTRPPSRPQRVERAPSIERLGEGLQKAGIQLNKGQLDQLWRYHNLIRKRNQDRELTRIIEFESMVQKHYVDSMIVGKFLTLPNPLLDVGTGAGFPGIPLKIRYPHLKLTLAEPRPNLIAFLEEARRELGLKHLEIFEHKVVSRSFTRPVKGVVTRAVEVIEKTVLRTSGCLETGGLLIFLKGPAVDPEIKVALKRFGHAYRVHQDEHYFLPGSDHERRLIVFEKIGHLNKEEETAEANEDSAEHSPQ